jgi:CBS domain-containing protein
MFSIYGVAGQVFSGTLEDMIRVRATEKVRSVRAIANDGVEQPGTARTMAVVAGSAAPSREDAVRAYRAMLPNELERGPLYHADQIMQRRVISVFADDDAGDAWRTLHDHGIHQAPVLNTDKRLVGIVSERDLLTVINIDAGRVVDSHARQVRNVMTTPVVATVPVTDIRRIASVMLDNRVDGVPITNDSGHLVGFVSRTDILRAVIVDPPLSLWR